MDVQRGAVQGILDPALFLDREASERRLSGGLSGRLNGHVYTWWKSFRSGGCEGRALTALESLEIARLERLVKRLVALEHIGQEYFLQLHHAGIQQHELGFDPILQDAPGDAGGLLPANLNIADLDPVLRQQVEDLGDVAGQRKRQRSVRSDQEPLQATGLTLLTIGGDNVRRTVLHQ